MAWEQLATAYDTVAQAYEDAFLDELDDKAEDRRLLRDFAGAADHPIVDLGCGPGQVGRFLQDHGRRVIGAHNSAAMAARASVHLGSAVVADIRRLPFGDASLGGVVAFYSIIHVRRDELGAAMAELRRALRPGGCVLLAAHQGVGLVEQEEFLGHAVPFVATLFTLDELVEATRRAGLHVTLARRRDPLVSEHPTERLYVAAERPVSSR